MITDRRHAIIRPMRSALLMAAVVTVALVAGWWVGEQARSREAGPPETGAIVLAHPRDPGAFKLVDHHGAPFTPERLAGRWTLWFFGFTHCPDICPMTLASLAMTDGLLAEAGATRPEVLMVSVDPARDDPGKLALYVPYFHPSFLGVTGTAGAIRELTDRLGVIVRYVATEGDDYTVDHSSQLMLVGPDGRVRAVFPSPHEPQTLAQELAALIPWLEKSS